MKILAIADRPPKNLIKTTVVSEKIDIICTLGDLDFFDIKELKEINDIPKIGVYGNHCSGKYFESLGIKNLHLTTFKFMGYTFGGFEGSLRYKQGKHIMYTQAEAERKLFNYEYVDIMLAHSPPYGVNDDINDNTHTGLIGLKRYIEAKCPKFFLHGHTYPSDPNKIVELGDTKIIYVYQDKVINL
ncbi:MAG: hypothetical protein HOE19_00535 [Candidatus Komeilibacteria bacterium]|jgi:uncharacterized protein|nr:hypothetical protein [Candidatus Komeilibacteria bacterium]MBT4447381.1 hypothetical protein [Candidatus Komeilibacteria bacterium]